MSGGVRQFASLQLADLQRGALGQSKSSEWTTQVGAPLRRIPRAKGRLMTARDLRTRRGGGCRRVAKRAVTRIGDGLLGTTTHRSAVSAPAPRCSPPSGLTDRSSESTRVPS